MILFKSVGRDLCVKFSYLQFIFKFKFVYELHVPIISVCFSHVGVKCSDTRSAHTGECRSAIWLKPKSWLIDMRRRWAFEQGAPYAVIIHRAALLANSLLLSSLLDSHMLFSPEIAGNIRRPDYQKAHYFYCSFIPQMLWDGREETDAASSFPTNLTKLKQFFSNTFASKRKHLSGASSHILIFAEWLETLLLVICPSGQGGWQVPAGACWEEQLNKHCIIVTVIIINIIIMIWMRWLTAVLVGSHWEELRLSKHCFSGSLWTGQL